MIADASVLIAFARAGRLGLLRKAVTKVAVPEAVDREVFRATLRPDMIAVQDAIDDGWIVVCKVDVAGLRALRRRYPSLDPGELACIALARAERSPLLLDDAQGRRAAAVEGLDFSGSLGILAVAAERKLLPDRAAVAAALRDLLLAGLWIDAGIVESFWARLGGRP